MTDAQLGFGWEGPEMPARAAALQPRLRGLAEQDIYIGASSWKYLGWLDQIYDRGRYTGGRGFQKSKFERECLREYAACFPTVGGDFSFYQFPSADMWRRTFAQLPDDYQFSLKVPEDVTVERFGRHPRYGQRAGMANAHFMDPTIVRNELLGPLEPYEKQLGVIMFEFGALHDTPTARTAEFARRLDGLLAGLPTAQLRFAVEVRNPNFVTPGSPYLACLKEHNVAHCFNSWTRMPPVIEQLDIAETFTAQHVAARFLLKPGRAYQQAVDLFAPYERVQDPYPEGRAGLKRLIEHCRAEAQALFAFVNNRFEGSAIETIEGILDETNA